MSGGMDRGFLEYIVANIDEDTPRLAFADWLDEHDQEDRAEFIRVQVQRARLSAWDPAQIRLRLREHELLNRHGERWLAELPAIEGVNWEGFRRGIVAEVSFASFEAMRATALACRAVAPIEAVTVRWPRQREAREAVPPIAELRELSLTGRPDGLNEVAWLAESPQLSTLRKLTVRGLWAEALRRLTASPHLGGLRVLHLPGNNLGNAGISALVSAASLTALEELDLTGQGGWDRYAQNEIVRAQGLEALARWPGLATVRSLTLAGTDMGRAGLRALLRSPHVGALKHLCLRNSRLDGQALAELDSALPALRLEVLDLGENILKDPGPEYVAIVPCLRELKVLHLDRCEIRLSGARLFAKKASFLGGLRALDVSFNHFGASGLGTLLDREPAVLHTLKLRDNDLNDEGAALLADSPASNTLHELDLSRNRLGPPAGRALGASAHLRELLVLRLTENQLGYLDAGALIRSPLGKRLSVLELDNFPFAPAPGAPPTGGDEIPF
jgi:uncharacterized protein (TIGR02996 family)